MYQKRWTVKSSRLLRHICVIMFESVSVAKETKARLVFLTAAGATSSGGTENCRAGARSAPVPDRSGSEPNEPVGVTPLTWLFRRARGRARFYSCSHHVLKSSVPPALIIIIIININNNNNNNNKQ